MHIQFYVIDAADGSGWNIKLAATLGCQLPFQLPRTSEGEAAKIHDKIASQANASIAEERSRRRLAEGCLHSMKIESGSAYVKAESDAGRHVNDQKMGRVPVQETA